MKNKNTFLLVGVVSGVAMIQSASAVSLTPVGTGADSSFLIFETPQVGILSFEVFYDFDPLAPIGTTDLLQILADNESSFTFDVTNNGNQAQPNEFLNSFTFNGITEAQPMDFSVFFGFFGAGGQTGVEFPVDTDGNFNFSDPLPDPQPIPFGEFTSTDGLSAPFRIVEPGSTDAIVFGPFGTFPSFDPIDPIPEPSTAMLLSSLCLLALRRRR